MKSRTAPLAALGLAGALALAACTPTEAPEPQPSMPATAATQDPTPTETQPAADAREAEYQEAVAAWTEQPPAGYAWPTSTADMPTAPSSQGLELQRADNVFRCMLIDAAWVAYFDDDDAEAASGFAARADGLYDGSMASVAVTQDGSVNAQQLATASGICDASVGDLKG